MLKSDKAATAERAATARRLYGEDELPSARALRRWPVAMLTGLVVMIGLALAWSAAPASAAGTYSTTATVNVRNGPGTSYGIIATKPGGASFALLCQWQGGTNVNGNATWDRVQFGDGLIGAVSDYWTTTPSWNNYAPGTGDCNAPPPPPPSSSTGGVSMQAACDRQYLNQGLSATVRDSHNAYSWVCASGTTAKGIDVNAACSAQYRAGASSGLGSSTNPYSWFCQWSKTTREQRAVDFANADLGRSDYAGWCELFVENAYGTQGQQQSALADFNAIQAGGRMHYTTSGIPAGALVFSRNPYDGGYGHVILSRGDGSFVSPQSPTQVLTDPRAGGTFSGWSFAPDGWPSR
jgi:hypothetical protein